MVCSCQRCRKTPKQECQCLHSTQKKGALGQGEMFVRNYDDSLCTGWLKAPTKIASKARAWLTIDRAVC
eukprot:1147386-Pelagomonas_calceolata.AAC.6